MKKPISAKDLLKQLEEDSEYQKNKKIKQNKLNKLDKILEQDERELISEINKIGYKIKSVYDFVNNNPHPFLTRSFVGTYSKAYTVLVKHLSINHHPRIREGIIRALTVKNAKIIASEVLLKEFYKEKDDNLKWVIANALRTLLPWRERQAYPEIKKILNNKNL